MKKILLSVVALAGLAFSAQAQEISKNAIGLRFGDNDGMGAEITYQRGLSDNNRLEIDFGWRNSDYYDAIKAAAIYQWVWNIDGGFNWYAGVGGGLGSWSYDLPNYKDSDFALFAAGQIGIEYNFDIPLHLSLDFRPELYLVKGDFIDSFGPDIALSARFKF